MRRAAARWRHDGVYQVGEAVKLASPSLSETLGGTPEAAEFGAALRDMRLAHNTDISSVASTLRIRQVYLQAIEDGRFGDLPGPTYAAGFVRAYAEYLGLEVPEVMRRYRDVTRDGATQAPLVAPSPVSEGRMPTGFILLMAVVLAGIAYGTWYYLTLNGRDAGDLVAKLPQKIADIVGMNRDSGETPTSSAVVPPPAVATQPAAPAPAQPVAQASTEPAPQPAPAAAPANPEPAPAPQESAAETAPTAPQPAPKTASAPPAEPSAPQPSASDSAAAAPASTETTTPPSESAAGDAAAPAATVSQAAPSAGGEAATPASPSAAETASASAANAPAATPAPETPAPAQPAASQQVAAAPPTAPAAPAPEEPGRVVLRATAISWVELRDAGGKRIFSRLLKKGETYNVPPKAGITLATGNAGALDILVDGQAIAPIGPVGAVRRDVLLEPEALLARNTAARQ